MSTTEPLRKRIFFELVESVKDQAAVATIGAYGTIAEVQGNLIMQSAPLSVLLMGDTVFVAGKPIDLDHNKFLKSAQKKGYVTLLNLAIHNSYHGKDGMTMQTEGKHGLPAWEGGAAWMKAHQEALGVRAMAPRTFNQKPAVRGLQPTTYTPTYPHVSDDVRTVWRWVDVLCRHNEGGGTPDTLPASTLTDAALQNIIDGACMAVRAYAREVLDARAAQAVNAPAGASTSAVVPQAAVTNAVVPQAPDAQGATHAQNAETQANEADDGLAASNPAKRPRTDAPSPAASLVADPKFLRGLQLAKDKRNDWDLKKVFNTFHLDGDLLRAEMKDAQTTTLVGRFVSCDDKQDYPFVQLLLVLKIDQKSYEFDMPGRAVTIMLACQLAAYEYSGKKPSDPALLELIERKREAEEELQWERQELLEEQRAYKLLTRDAVKDGRIADAYKECTTHNLHHAFSFIFKDGTVGGVTVRQKLAQSVSDPIVTAIGSNLILEAVVECMRWKEGGLQAAKLQLVHELDGQPFRVWVTDWTFKLMEHVPAYRKIIDQVDWKAIKQEIYLHRGFEGELAKRRGEAFDSRAKMRSWRPLEYEWPQPELLRPRFSGPADVPRLEAKSDSWVQFLHALKATEDAELSARTLNPPYSSRAYDNAFMESQLLMMNRCGCIRVGLLHSCYSNFCGRKQLERVERFREVTDFTVAFLAAYNLVLARETTDDAVPSVGEACSGNVYGISTAPPSVYAERASLTQEDRYGAMQFLQGRVQDAEPLVPPHLQDLPISQKRHFVARLLMKEPSNPQSADEISNAQSEARLYLQDHSVASTALQGASSTTNPSTRTGSIFGRDYDRERAKRLKDNSAQAGSSVVGASDEMTD